MKVLYFSEYSTPVEKKLLDALRRLEGVRSLEVCRSAVRFSNQLRRRRDDYSFSVLMARSGSDIDTLTKMREMISVLPFVVVHGAMDEAALHRLQGGLSPLFLCCKEEAAGRIEAFILSGGFTAVRSEPQLDRQGG